MIAVGPGAPDKDGKIVPTAVKTGDKVLLPGWGGNSIKLGEEVSAQDSSKPSQAPEIELWQRNTSSSGTLRFWPRSRSRSELGTRTCT